MKIETETLLNAHLEAENAHDLDAIMATFTDAPVVELNGQRIAGRARVHEFHRSFGFGGAGMGSFSDVRVAERRRHHAREAIIIEQTLTGVHTGEWQGLAPTGRSFALAVCTVYVLDESGRVAEERVYFDQGWLRRQLER